MTIGTCLAIAAAIAAGTAPFAATGCITPSCEDSCADQYDDCIARAPPGASRADCSDEYNRCLQSCSASYGSDDPAPL